LPEVWLGLVGRVVVLGLVVPNHMVPMVWYGRHCLGSEDPAGVKTTQNQQLSPTHNNQP